MMRRADLDFSNGADPVKLMWVYVIERP